MRAQLGIQNVYDGGHTYAGDVVQILPEGPVEVLQHGPPLLAAPYAHSMRRSQNALRSSTVLVPTRLERRLLSPVGHVTCFVTAHIQRRTQKQSPS